MFAFGPGDLHHASGATITQTVSGLPAPFVYLALHSSTSFSLSYFATPAIVHCSSRRWSGDSHVDLRRSLETDYLKRARPRVVKVSEPHRRAPSASMSPQPPPFLSRLTMFPPEGRRPPPFTPGRPPVASEPDAAMSQPNPFIANGTCYTGKGARADSAFIPCGNAAFGHLPCCSRGDMCLADRACYNGQMVNSERHISSGAQIPNTATTNAPRNNSVSSVAGDGSWIRSTNHDAAI